LAWGDRGLWALVASCLTHRYPWAFCTAYLGLLLGWSGYDRRRRQSRLFCRVSPYDGFEIRHIKHCSGGMPAGGPGGDPPASTDDRATKKRIADQAAPSWVPSCSARARGRCRPDPSTSIGASPNGLDPASTRVETDRCVWASRERQHTPCCPRCQRERRIPAVIKDVGLEIDRGRIGLLGGAFACGSQSDERGESALSWDA
jgi:hypothetical protein